MLVELLQFEKTQEAWEMNDESKIEQATLAKQKGTERLKSKHFSLAIQHYSRVIALLDHQETKVLLTNSKSAKGVGFKRFILQGFKLIQKCRTLSMCFLTEHLEN